MGLFSDKTMLTAGVSVSPLVQHKPNLARDAIIRATLNDWDKTATITDALIAGYPINPDKYYEYGAKQDGFVNGLPDGAIISEQPKIEIFKQRAAAQFGFSVSEVTFSEARHGFPNAREALWNWIHKNYFVDYNYGKIEDDNFPNSLGYPTTTSNESISSGTEVYADYEGIQTAGTQTPIVRNWSDTHDVTVNTHVADLNNRSYIAVFTRDGTGDFRTYYYIYDPVTNVYPDLDPDNEQSQNSPYYPIMPLVINKRFINEAEDAQLYITGNALLDHVNMDIDTIQEALRDNPDVNKVDDSFVCLGIPIGRNHTQSEEAIKYLYMYFEYLKGTETVTKQEHIDSVSEGRPKFNRFKITDAEFDMELIWNYIDVTTESHFGHPPGYTISWQVDSGVPYDPTDDSFVSPDLLILTKYTNNSKTQIIVRGVFHVSYVIQKKPTVNTLRSVFSNEETIESDGFFVPLNKTVIDRMSKKEKTAVTFEAVILVTYAIERTKIKWYQRKAFWNFIRLVVFIVSIVYASPQLSVMVEAAASEIVAMVIESILVDFLIDQAVGYMLGMLVDAIGGELALVLAAVAAAYGATSALTTVTVNLALPLATELMKISSLMVEKINQHTKRKYEDLVDEIDDFTKEAKQAMEELKEASASLVNGYFDPLWYIESSGIVSGESPSEFFTRTLLVSNDVASLDSISNYVDNQLTLPNGNDLINKL